MALPGTIDLGPYCTIIQHERTFQWLAYHTWLPGTGAVPLAGPGIRYDTVRGPTHVRVGLGPRP